VGAPRTGVEIVATDERDGSRYHTMRDLRNGSVVKNVTRSSARKLWHYAISAKESGVLNPEHVSWQGDIGLWRKTHKGGTTRYDLVQRGDGELRVFYGVTEDGIHGAWRRLVESSPDSAGVPAQEAAAMTEAVTALGEVPAVAGPLEAEQLAIADEAVAEMVAREAEDLVDMSAGPSAEPAEEMVLVPPASELASETEAGQAEPPARGRGRGGRSTKKTAAKSSKAPARKTTKTKAPANSRPRTRRSTQPAE
jgi:hypothetical protein